MGHWQRRYAQAPWSEIAPADLEPQGDPETAIDYRHETHLGLYVKGEHIPYIGMLAVRCESRGMHLVPIGLAIADTPIACHHAPVQSGVQRHPYRADLDVNPEGDEGNNRGLDT